MEITLGHGVLSDVELFTKFKTKEVKNSCGWKEWLPENIPEFEWILWSLGMCTDSIYNLWI